MPEIDKTEIDEKLRGNKKNIHHIIAIKRTNYKKLMMSKLDSFRAKILNPHTFEGNNCDIACIKARILNFL